VNTLDIKDRIINAALELIGIRGFHGFTMDELSELAGISKRTLYRYFSSKDIVLEKAIDTFLLQMEIAVQQILTTEQQPQEIVKEILNYLINRCRFIANRQSMQNLKVYYPTLWKKIDNFRIARFKSVLDSFSNSQYSLKASQFNPQIILAVITAAIQAVLNPDFIIENNLTIEEAVEQLSHIIILLLFENTTER